MTDTSDRANVVHRYYLYRAVGNPGFIYPVYVLYMVAHGLTFAQIGVIGAIQSVIVVGGEIPTGYVGDRVGRRNSLVLAQLLYTASAVLFLAADSFPGFTAGFAVLSVGMTFVSGSADAWLYDILEARRSDDCYTHVRGRGAAIGQWAMAATMIAGSLLYVADHRYPFVALLAARVATFAVVLTLPKTARYADGATDGDGGDGHDRLAVADALTVVRERVTRPPLRSFVAYLAVFFGAVSTVDAFVQPVTVDALDAAAPLLSSLGVPEAASLGVLYAAFTAVSAVASDRASTVADALGVRAAVLVVPAAVAVLLVAPVVVPLLAFPAFFGAKAARSILRPITGQYVNDRVESAGRATVLSAVSMVYGLARVPFALGSGVVATAVSPVAAVASLGLAFLVAGGALALRRPPVRRSSTGDAAAAPSD